MNHKKQLLLLFTGAGFSALAGAPVMNQFLLRAEDRLAEDLLRCIRAGFYFAGYALHEEPNLETAYGAAVFREVIHKPDFRVATFQRNNGHDVFVPSRDGPRLKDVVEGFERGIACLYGQAVLENCNQWLGYYSEFFSYLLEHYRLGVLTTNYDRVIETALHKIDRESSYSVAGASCRPENPIPILKLHGSVNWPQTRNLDLRTIATDAEPLDKPLVLPPTWNKNVHSSGVFAGVWRGAVDLIGAADAVLVIGHSFPSTDLHLGYLFAEGMSKRGGQPERKRVTVVDQNVIVGASVCSRFHRYQTVEHVVLHGVRFEEILSCLKESSIAL